MYTLVQISGWRSGKGAVKDTPSVEKSLNNMPVLIQILVTQCIPFIS